VVDVVVSVSEPRREALIRTHGADKVPAPVSLRAIIDTGASISGFHPSVYSSLDLTPVQIAPFLTPSTPHDQPADCGVFDVGLRLTVGSVALRFNRIVATESRDFDPSNPNRILGILGRDVLEHCVFEYLGPDGLFRLRLVSP
jgi:hypothetical protein